MLTCETKIVKKRNITNNKNSKLMSIKNKTNYIIVNKNVSTLKAFKGPSFDPPYCCWHAFT
jgi:hypothetical protein